MKTDQSWLRRVEAVIVGVAVLVVVVAYIVSRL
jgi:hypothetical protein